MEYRKLPGRSCPMHAKWPTRASRFKPHPSANLCHTHSPLYLESVAFPSQDRQGCLHGEGATMVGWIPHAHLPVLSEPRPYAFRLTEWDIPCSLISATFHNQTIIDGSTICHFLEANPSSAAVYHATGETCKDRLALVGQHERGKQHSVATENQLLSAPLRAPLLAPPPN